MNVKIINLRQTTELKGNVGLPPPGGHTAKNLSLYGLIKRVIPKGRAAKFRIDSNFIKTNRLWEERFGRRKFTQLVKFGILSLEVVFDVQIIFFLYQ